MPILPKQQLRQLVAVACTDDALRQLLELLAGVQAHSKAYRAMNLLSGQWQELDEQVRLNLLPFKEASTHRARINAAVLDYLEQLPDEIAAPKSKKIAPEAILRRNVQAMAADATWEYDLFFSFSSLDIEAAGHFCHALRGHGLRVFFSADDLRLRGGHNFANVIDRALRQSRHFMLFCSPHAMASEWVELEHDTFFQNYHLPQKHERGFYIAEGPDFDPELVPAFYRRIQRVRDPESLLHALTGFAATSGNTVAENPPTAPAAVKTNPADDISWKIACKTNTAAAYRGYLDKWPKGLHAAEAADRIEDLTNDQYLWDYLNAHSSPDTLEENLRAYLEAFPGGLYAKEAREQITVNERAREAEAKRIRQEKEAEKRKQKEVEDAEKRRAEAEALARKQREEKEKADHHTFYLAVTRADFEAYLKKGYVLHTAEANEKIAEFKKQEQKAEEKRRAVEAEKKRLAGLAVKAKKEKEEAERKRKEEEEARRADPFRELMVPIQGGSFQFGGKLPITIKDFHLGKYPVTQAQWKKIMGDNPGHFKGDDLPVEQVSWDDVQAFLKKLNGMLPSGQKPYRLPSETEWEYAAKGGKQSKGFEYAGSNNLEEVGWYTKNSGSKTHPVGQKKPNELGLYDMSGNVWEWCQDVWDSDLKNTPGNGTVREKGGDILYRVVRCGSWVDPSDNCRVACRSRLTSSVRSSAFGFRLAR